MPDDHSDLVPPLPIPNRTVKRICADDSAATSVKVGHRQAFIRKPPSSNLVGGFCFYAKYSSHTINSNPLPHKHPPNTERLNLTSLLLIPAFQPASIQNRKTLICIAASQFLFDLACSTIHAFDNMCVRALNFPGWYVSRSTHCDKV